MKLTQSTECLVFFGKSTDLSITEYSKDFQGTGFQNDTKHGFEKKWLYIYNLRIFTLITYCQKIRDIKYKELKIQPYMKSGIFTNTMVTTLFNMRSSMTRNIKNNFSSMHR